MKRKIPYIWLSIIVVTIFQLFFAASIQAEIKLEIKLSNSILILGDEISLQLKIDGIQDPVVLIFPSITGLSFRQLGAPSSSSQTIIVNGKVSRFSGLVYNIGIRGEKTGQYRVPGIRLTYKKKNYTSPPFNIRVRAQEQISSMKVRTEVSRQSIYLNQPLFITLKWYIQDDIEDYVFKFPLLDRKDDLGLKLRDTPGSGNSSNINIENYRIPFSQGSETINGESYTTYETQFEIYPNESGEFRIPPASVKASVRSGYELRKDFFGRTVRSPKLKQIFTSSKALSILVKNLPENDRPETFTGAVGTFRVSLTTTANTVKVGDPVELTIRIRGKGRFAKIEQPVLSNLPEYKNNFVVVDNIQPGDIQEDGILFKQTIRPRHDRIDRIPPLAFTFFDPDKEKFVTIESNSLSLKVLPTKQISEDDIVVYDSNQPTSGNFTLTKKDSGIFTIYAFEDALQPQTQSWSWYLLLIFPPLIYFITLLATNRYQKLHSNSALSRSKSAVVNKNKRLKKLKKMIADDGSAFYQELSRTLAGFISDRLNLGTGELTTVDIQELKKEHRLSSTLTDQIAEYIQEFDRIRFTNQEPSTEDKQKALVEVNRLIRDLNKEL